MKGPHTTVWTAGQLAFWNKASATKLGNGLIVIRERASGLESCVDARNLQYVHGGLPAKVAEAYALEAFDASAMVDERDNRTFGRGPVEEQRAAELAMAMDGRAVAMDREIVSDADLLGRILTMVDIEQRGVVALNEIVLAHRNRIARQERRDSAVAVVARAYVAGGVR